MFIPLHDGVPLTYLRWPIANYGLIGLNIITFLFVAAAHIDTQHLNIALGVVPAVLFGHAVLGHGLALVPTWGTLVTGMFVHGGFLHLAGNMLFLWVFGDNVEDAMGSLRYVAFYVVAGGAGALLYAAMAPQSEAPLIGASGAIAGVLAAYLILYPRVRVFGVMFNILPLRVPAVWVLGAWFSVQVAYAILANNAGDVGWWAHVGGFLAGGLLTPFVRRPGVMLFGPGSRLVSPR